MNAQFHSLPSVKRMSASIVVSSDDAAVSPYVKNGWLPEVCPALQIHHD
jgi:hypothetical protein